MKVSIATTTAFHLKHLACGLIEKGVDLRFGTSLPKWRTRQYGLDNSAVESVFLPTVPNSIFALSQHFGVSRQRHHTEVMLSRADRALADRLPRADVLVGLSSVAVEVARRMRSDFGARIIVDRGAKHVLEQQKVLGNKVKLSPGYIDREILSYQEADLIVVPSMHAKRSFMEQGFPEDIVQVNSLGVDLKRFRPQPRQESPRLDKASYVYVGNWGYEKGSDLLSQFVVSNPDINLTHIGTKKDVAIPDVPNFKSIGHVANVHLPKELAKHDVLLLPSRQDGFGMVLNEALAVGLRVIATSSTGLPDLAKLGICRRAYRIIEPNNFVALKNAIRETDEVISSSGALSNEEVQETRAKISWLSYVNRYLTIIESTIA